MSGPVLAVGGVLLDELDGEVCVCLVRRARPPLANCWSLPGGRVEAGEGLEEALRREMREETGLEVAVGPLIEVVELNDGTNHYVVLDYLCRKVSGELWAGDDAAEVCVKAVKALEGLELTSAVKRVVEKALALLACKD